jgi:hypothetical protein
MRILNASRAVSGLKIAAGAMVLAGILAPTVQAQDTNDVKRLTVLTFSAPVQLPGMTLPAGKYRFEMADVSNAAHVVRVSSEDGKKVFGTFSTISTTTPTRDLRSTDTLVMWAERPAGQPQAAKEWYYPQRSIGEEFVYPKAQAQAIAAANHASVPTEDNGKIVRIEGNDQATTPQASPAPQVAENRPAQNTAPERAPASVGTSGQGNTPDPAPAPARRTLPRTASQLGLFELLSAVTIAAALGVRQLRLRTAARG